MRAKKISKSYTAVYFSARRGPLRDTSAAEAASPDTERAYLTEILLLKIYIFRIIAQMPMHYSAY